MGITTTSRVGPKGQVVIPKEFRDRMGIGPGSSVTFRFRPDDRVLELEPRWSDPIREGPAVIRALTGSAKDGRSGTAQLLAMRKEDEALWEAQFERWASARKRRSASGTKRSSSTPSRS